MPRPRPSFLGFRTVFGGLFSALGDPRVRYLVMTTFALIAVASVFYSMVEGWRLLDAVYFSTMTIATVGYGDFVPRTSAGRMFTVFYVLVGIGLFVAAASSFAEHLIDYGRRLERLDRERFDPERETGP